MPLVIQLRLDQFGKKCFETEMLELAMKIPAIAGSRNSRLGGLLVLLGVLLAGCGGIEAPFLALSGATTTTINSDKLPTDFIADYFTGLDCNTVRQSRDGGPLCRAPRLGVIEQPKYCYNSLGSITCYSSPDPYRDGRETVQ